MDFAFRFTIGGNEILHNSSTNLVKSSAFIRRPGYSPAHWDSDGFGGRGDPLAACPASFRNDRRSSIRGAIP